MKINDVYEQGTIAFVEQFTIAEEELRQYVVYTYYDKNEEPLYVGRSRAFYDTHHLNYDNKDFMDEVEYIGFLVFDNEEITKVAVKDVINYRKPKHNKRHYKVDETLIVPEDDIVLKKDQMEQRWREWLS